MKSPSGAIFAALLVLLVLVFTPPAEAYTTQLFPIGFTTADSWTLCNKATGATCSTAIATFTLGNYSNWAMNVVLRGDSINVLPYWRARVALLQSPTTYYYTPWRAFPGLDSLLVKDSAYTASPFLLTVKMDSAAFFDEYQVRFKGQDAKNGNATRLRAQVIRVGSRF